MTSRHPRPFAHRLAAYAAAGLFSLGVLGTTFRDAARSALHSAVRQAGLPALVRPALGEPGAEWVGAGVAEESQLAAERARAEADLARVRAETRALRAANLAFRGREARDGRRPGQLARRQPTLPSASGAAKGWVGPTRMAVTVHGASIERAIGGCAARSLADAAVTLDAERLRLAVLADLPRGMFVTGTPAALTGQQGDSIVVVRADHLDTAALREMHVGRVAGVHVSAAAGEAPEPAVPEELSRLARHACG